MSSPITVIYAKPSRFSFFYFDPGGASEDTGYTVRYSELVLDQQSTSIWDLVSFTLSTDLIMELLFAVLTFAKLPKSMILVFDPGGKHTLHVALTMREEDKSVLVDLSSPKLTEDPILVFDPGGSLAVDNFVAVRCS